MTDPTMELFRQKALEFQQHKIRVQALGKIAAIAANHPAWIEQEPGLAGLLGQCGFTIKSQEENQAS